MGNLENLDRSKSKLNFAHRKQIVGFRSRKCADSKSEIRIENGRDDAALHTHQTLSKIKINTLIEKEVRIKF